EERVAEVQMRFRQPRVELDGTPRVLHRAAQVAEAVQHVTQVRMQARIIRRLRKRLAESTCRGLIPAESGEEISVFMQIRRGSIAGEQPLVMDERFRTSPGGVEEPGELRDGARVVGPKLERALEARDGRLLLARLRERAPQVVVGLRESGLELRQAPIPLDRC